MGSLISSFYEEWPNWPFSFLPNEYTKPDEVNNNEWLLPQEIWDMKWDCIEFNFRKLKVNLCSAVILEGLFWKKSSGSPTWLKSDYDSSEDF